MKVEWGIRTLGPLSRWGGRLIHVDRGESGGIIEELIASMNVVKGRV